MSSIWLIKAAFKIQGIGATGPVILGMVAFVSTVLLIIHETALWLVEQIAKPFANPFFPSDSFKKNPVSYLLARRYRAQRRLEDAVMQYENNIEFHPGCHRQARRYLHPRPLNMLRPLFQLLALLALVGCKPTGDTLRGTPAELNMVRSTGECVFSAGNVVTWAQLDDHFRHRTAELEVGQADGKTLLGRLVMLENGAEAADFLKTHGCTQISEVVGVRKLNTALEVEVEITGKDGKKLILILKSDGTPQGEG